MGWFGRIWALVMRPSARIPAVILLGAGGFAGLVFAGGFASFVQYTNTIEFCTSCHEMESTVYQEFLKTPHAKTPSGVGPVCSDCHVAHDNWMRTVLFKVKATKELYMHLIGELDTREKFEAKRLELAKHVWALMKETDSRECRHCHKVDRMDLTRQSRRAFAQHSDAKEEGETCIDCHKGIAHKPVHKELEEEKPDEGGFNLGFLEPRGGGSARGRIQ